MEIHCFSSGVQKSENKGLAGLAPSEVCEGGSAPCLSPSFCDLLATFSVLGLWKHHPVSGFIFTWRSLCVPACVQISPFYKDISHWIRGPPA